MKSFMGDQGRTKAELLGELAALRKQVADFDALAIEHKKIMEALQESETRYRTLFECANEPIFVETVNDDIVDANPKACDLLGYTRAELLKMKVSNLQAPEVRHNSGGIIQAELSQHSGRVFEAVDLRKDGSRISVEISNSRLGDTGLIFSIVRDISQRRQMENRLHDSEEQYRLLVENAPDAIFVQTNEHFTYVNAEALKLAGADRPDQLLGQPVEERFPPRFREIVRTRMRLLNEERVPVPVMEEVFLRLDGSEVDVEASGVPIVYNGSNGALIFMRDISQRKRAVEQLNWTSEVNAAIAELFRPLTTPGTTIQQITGEVLKQARKLTQSRHGYVSEIDPVTGSNITHTLTSMVAERCSMRVSGQKIVFNPGPDGKFPGLWGFSMNTGESLFTNSAQTHPTAIGTPEGHIPVERFLSVPVKLGEELVGQIALANSDRDYTERDLKAIERLAGYYALAILRVRKDQELRTLNESLAQAQQIAHLASWQYNLSTRQASWSSELYTIFGFPPDSPAALDTVLECIHPDDRKRFHQVFVASIVHGAPFNIDHRLIRPDGEERYIHNEGAVICDEQGKAMHLFGTSLDITDHQKAIQERQKQVERLEALHEIDKAVAASQDMNITMDALLRQVTGQLKVDAADILLYDANTQMLTNACEYGFQTPRGNNSSLPTGRAFAWKVILTRQKILFNPLPDNFLQKDNVLFTKEGFKLYLGLPLIAKGQVKGVLEIYHRSLLSPDKEWLDYLDILVGQAAVAIDNLQMLENLQHANMDLSLAYDTTIEGWARALDLRDKETEGHSRRVMELSVRLARAMGMQNEALVHVYRGALLHDIGKMGLPDKILLKPSSLTPEEFDKMRQHPTLAFELLSPIPYLRKALEIPYCHHEKWDGTGYPRGLAGVQIPLAARIFAVVDVWDALLSDRPYRAAWPKDQAIAHIQNQAGRHFDPQVVDAFLDIIDKKSGKARPVTDIGLIRRG